MEAFGLGPYKSGWNTDLLILRSLFALDPTTGQPISTNFVLTTDGIGGLVWLNPFDNLSTAGAASGVVGYLPSTLSTLFANDVFFSTAISTFSTTMTTQFLSATTSLYNLIQAGGIQPTAFISTVEGLGTAGYVSSTQLASTTDFLLDPVRYISSGNLISTVAGINAGSLFATQENLTSSLVGAGTFGYVSSTQLASTVEGLGTSDYISTPSLASTLVGLGSFGYVSSATFLSGLAGLGSGGYISSATFQSTLDGLGTAGFISSPTLISSLAALGTSGYISSASLQSTVEGLGTSGYVSSTQLASTVAFLQDTLSNQIQIDRAPGSVNIYNSVVNICTAGAVFYISSFLFSSLTYEGTNGSVIAWSNANDIYFSTAVVRFDNFSSFITSNSRVTLDIYPTFAFPELNTGALAYGLFPISTFLTYGSNLLSTTTVTGTLVANSKTAGFTNFYQQALKMQIQGSVLSDNYSNQYILNHYMPNSLTNLTFPGLKSNNVFVQYSSTNSLFVSVQNLF
jgi:hypothetical protein